jgi:hypothetical protein
MWLKFWPIGNLPGSVKVEQLLGLPVPLLHNAQALPAWRPSPFFTTVAREQVGMVILVGPVLDCSLSNNELF